MNKSPKQERYPGHHNEIQEVLKVLDESWEDFIPIGMTSDLKEDIKKQLEEELK